jgi:hypothetical protein
MTIEATELARVLRDANYDAAAGAPEAGESEVDLSDVRRDDLLGITGSGAPSKPMPDAQPSPPRFSNSSMRSAVSNTNATTAAPSGTTSTSTWFLNSSDPGDLPTAAGHLERDAV